MPTEDEKKYLEWLGNAAPIDVCAGYNFGLSGKNILPNKDIFLMSLNQLLSAACHHDTAVDPVLRAYPDFMTDLASIVELLRLLDKRLKTGKTPVATIASTVSILYRQMRNITVKLETGKDAEFNSAVASYFKCLSMFLSWIVDMMDKGKSSGASFFLF